MKKLSKRIAEELEKANQMCAETVFDMEFLRRFLLHVLPKGPYGNTDKIRYYGLWHPSKKSLQISAKVLLVFRKPTGKEPLLQTSEIPPPEPIGEENIRYGERCPKCGGEHLELLEERARWFLPPDLARLKDLSLGDP